MQEEEIYMTLNVKSKRTSIQACQLQCKDCSVMLQWYKTSLWISGMINVFMVLILVSLILLVSQGMLVKCQIKDNASIIEHNDIGNLDVINNTGINKDTSCCVLEAGDHEDLCLSEWFKYQGKCYWFSSEKKSWADSYEYCQERKSHLLIIQNQFEVDFVQKHVKQSNYVWIGLNFTTLKKTWTWVDGSPLDANIFLVRGPTKENSCVVIKESKMYSEKCSHVFKWICQY